MATKYIIERKINMKKKILNLIVLALVICLSISVIPGCKEEKKDGPVLYQLGPDTDMLMMGYVIKTTNDKYIVIDGGSAGGSEGYILNALQDITGQEIPEIEAWFLSHLHDDHVMEFCDLARYYVPEFADIKINNVYFNFPSEKFMKKTEGGNYAFIRDRVAESYDTFLGEGEFEKTNGKNVFEGDTIYIDDVKIDILLTVTDEEKETNINDTSLIFRVTMADQTVLFLGDAGVAEGKRLLEKYGEDLKSDFVQMAHHGQGGVDKDVYEAINPTVCLWPAPRWVFNNINGNLQSFTVRQWMIDIGVKYHVVSGIDFTQSFEFPVDFSKLEERDITPPEA